MQTLQKMNASGYSIRKPTIMLTSEPHNIYSKTLNEFPTVTALSKLRNLQIHETTPIFICPMTNWI